jgi:hypothetical protein
LGLGGAAEEADARDPGVLLDPVGDCFCSNGCDVPEPLVGGVLASVEEDGEVAVAVLGAVLASILRISRTGAGGAEPGRAAVGDVGVEVGVDESPPLLGE